jgi:hypothetical protein
MTTKQVHDILKVVAWIIFIGLCIETGAKVVSIFVSQFMNHGAAKNLYMGMDLSALYESSELHFIIMALLLIILPALKAYLFFWVIRITSNLDIARPFSEYNAHLILKMSKISLQIGITAFITGSYAGWLETTKIRIPHADGGTEYLFLAGILFVIVQIFKRGIELQTENELTI